MPIANLPCTSLLRAAGFGLVLLTQWVASAAAADTQSPGNSSHCPAFESSPLYRKPASVHIADPSNWIEVIRSAQAGDEILLEDGTYNYKGYAVVFEQPITLRGKSGIRENVVIQGNGYGEPSEALMVMADDVHLADLTVRDVHDHAISFKEGFARSIVYNVNLFDIGTQHIKGSRMGPDGIVACSSIGYQSPTGTGDYNSGIDLHGAHHWTIRDNDFYNIYGDGSGCVVDRDCGTQYPGGGSAILLWKDSSNNIIERNKITESFRGISLGLSTPYSGGVVRNNVISRMLEGKEGVNGYLEADTGISLIGADNVLVEGNTVILAGNYPGPIEVQDANGIVVRNNLISKPVWNRGNADYNGCTSQRPEDCEDHKFGNLVVGDVVLQQAQTDATNESSLTQVEEPQQPAIAESVSPSSDASSQSTPENSQIAPDGADIPAAVATDHTARELITKLDASIERLQRERMLATAERLKMKEERLLFQQADLAKREQQVKVQEAKLRKMLLTIQEALNTEISEY